MRKPLCIIISGKHPLSSSGGYATYANNLAHLMQSLHYDVALFCIGETTRIEKSSLGTIYTIRQPLLRLFGSQQMIGFPLSSFLIARAIHSSFGKTPFFIWGVGPWSFTGIILGLFTKTYLIASYFTTIAHEFAGMQSAIRKSEYGIGTALLTLMSTPFIPIYTLFESLILTRSQVIVTHYRSIERILQREFGISHKKICHLPYAITPIPTQHHTTKNKTKPPLILCVSRHDARKGIPVLLHALTLLPPIPYRAIIAGGGPLLAAHRHLAKKLHLKQVTIPGHVRHLDSLFQQASLFVLPSLEEGSSSLALLEAMGEGLPIVSTAIDGIPEDITSGKSGILIPPNNVQRLVDSMKELLTNRKLARQLGSTAKKHYMNKFDRKTVQKKVKQFLDLLVLPHYTE